MPGRRVAVRASSTDVVEAAGRAFLAAINQHGLKAQQRAEPSQKSRDAVKPRIRELLSRIRSPLAMVIDSLACISSIERSAPAKTRARTATGRISQQQQRQDAHLPIHPPLKPMHTGPAIA